MSNVTDFLVMLGKNWYFVLAGIGIICLLVTYGAAYFRALRPRSGTLEWISCYDRPGFGLSGWCFPMEKADALPLLCLCLAAAAIWGFAAWKNLAALYDGADFPAETLARAAVYYLILPAAAAAGAYVMFKGLFGVTRVAVFGVLALSLDMTVSPVPTVFAVMTVLFLLRFLTARPERRFVDRLPSLILCFALLTIGCYFEPALAVLGLAAVVLLAAGCIARFVELGAGNLAASLASAAAAAAVTTLLLYIPAALIGGMGFPQLLLSPAYYLLIAQRVAALFGGLFRWQPEFAYSAAYYDWPMMLCGLCAMAASLIALFRRRDYRGLVLPVLFAALTVMWLLCGVYLLPLACAACLCGVWAELCRRGKSLLAGIGAACILLILASQYVISWIVL